MLVHHNYAVAVTCRDQEPRCPPFKLSQNRGNIHSSSYFIDLDIMFSFVSLNAEHHHIDCFRFDFAYCLELLMVHTAHLVLDVSVYFGFLM